MLIEFTVTNYRSILSSQTLSLVSGKGDELIDDNTFSLGAPNNMRLLHSAAIYGPNAGGKSNLLRALFTMKKMVIASAISQQRGDVLPMDSFKLDKESVKLPSEFEIIFVTKGTRYQYGFSATQKRINHEWLIAYPKGRPQKWFERIWDSDKQQYHWDLGNALQGEKIIWQNATRDNALFLSTAVQLNSTQLQSVFDWFKNKLRTLISTMDGAQSTAELYESDKKNQVIKFLNAADLAIYDISIEKEKFDSEKWLHGLPNELKEFMAKDMEGRTVFDIKTIHKTYQNELVFFDLNDESDGTKKMFCIAALWIDSLTNGDVLFIDELDNSLHPKLLKFLVQLFNNRKTNPNNAQLIFTVHDTSILDQDEVFRRDQIWFCKKNKHQATQLYPLTDFSPRKKRENLKAAYLSGRYGALPYIDIDELGRD